MAAGEVVRYAACALIGTVVGGTELLTKYRDSQRELLRLWSLWLYVGVNAGAACLVLAVARANGWTFGLPLAQHWAQVLGAGIAAMAVLRVGLGFFRFGDRDIPAGPGAVMVAMQAICERNIDRRQAGRRSQRARELMTGVSFVKAVDALPTHCLLALKTASKEESQELAAAVADIAKDERSSDQAKAYNLGVALINFAGPELLAQAVRTLGDDIRVPVESSGPIG